MRAHRVILAAAHRAIDLIGGSRNPATRKMKMPRRTKTLDAVYEYLDRGAVIDSGKDVRYVRVLRARFDERNGGFVLAVDFQLTSDGKQPCDVEKMLSMPSRGSDRGGLNGLPGFSTFQFVTSEDPADQIRQFVLFASRAPDSSIFNAPPKRVIEPVAHLIS